MKYLLSAIMLTSLFLGGCSSSSNSTPPVPAPPTIESLDVTPKGETLDVGTTQKYTAIAKFTSNTYEDVTDQATWSLADNNGSVVFDQTDPSEVRAAATGTDSIVATFDGYTTTGFETAGATVVDEALVSIEVAPVNHELILGVTHQYIAMGTYAGGRTQDLTEESNWMSGNASIVAIDENGFASPVIVGATTITASFDGQMDITNVGVSNPNEIDYIVISPEGYDFFTNEIRQFNAFAHFADPSKPEELVTKECTWTSSDTSLVSLVLGATSRPGLFNSKENTGSAEITCDFNINLDATIDVTVEQPRVTRIVISPREVTLSVGEDRRFFTEAVDQRGKLYSVNTHPDQVYSVDDPSILYIANDPDNAGKARALSVGQVTVTSTFEYEGEIFVSHATVTVQ